METSAKNGGRTLKESGRSVTSGPLTAGRAR
jgi:hypothetical protein